MQQVLADLLLISKSRGIDSGQAKLESLLAGELVVDGRDGVVADLVVIAQVADGGGELGIVLEPILPVVVEEVVEGLPAVGKRGGSSRACRELSMELGKRREQQEG